jgi:hypothetical protein
VLYRVQYVGEIDKNAKRKYVVTSQLNERSHCSTFYVLYTNTIEHVKFPKLPRDGQMC